MPDVHVFASFFHVPPRKIASYYLDYSEADTEDVTEGMLLSALARTASGIERHIELTVEGASPVKKVGVACRWCPLRNDCPEGRVYLNTDGDDIVVGRELARFNMLRQQEKNPDDKPNLSLADFIAPRESGDRKSTRLNSSHRT